jgi:hypothetical protein
MKMNPKYSNIFWHQGVKVFGENLLKTESGRLKIEHLENDVTKALLNVFDHCSPKVLGTFLKLINIKESPHAFDFDFQITENQTYQQRRNRVFLAIVTESTKTISAPSYDKSISRPDACIHSENTAILIEAKTQSHLIKEQNENHIKHFLGTATDTHRITWEMISERLKLSINSLKERDKFLVSQFCDFLDLIGIAEFDGFNKTDFIMLGSIEKVTTEDFVDFKRIFLKKIEKFMGYLNQEIKPIINTSKYESHIMRGKLNSPAVFSAFYFYDESPDIHINKYPSLNFIYNESGIQFTITGEVQSSFKMILKKITDNPNEFSKIASKLTKFNFYLYYKLQFTPMNNFLWNLVPGFPRKMGTFKAADIITAIKNFKEGWIDYKTTTLFQMESNVLKHYTGRFFEEKEIQYAENKNPKPNFAIRIGKRYEAAQIDKLGKKIVPYFKREISKFNKLIDFLRP